MEDAHTCYVSLNDQLSQWSFFAVFDGHAGKIAAEICSKDLVEEIRKTLLNDDTLNVRHWFKNAIQWGTLFVPKIFLRRTIL